MTEPLYTARAQSDHVSPVTPQPLVGPQSFFQYGPIPSEDESVVMVCTSRVFDSL